MPPCRLLVEPGNILVGMLGKRGTPGATHLGLTQGEASVELQVGGEKSGQAGKNLATGLPSVDLIAAVDQAVGGAPVVCFVQHSAEQLPFPDNHLRKGGPPMLGWR